MASKACELQAMGEMIPPTPEIAEETRIFQARAPYYGLGFKKDRLDQDVFDLLQDQFRASAPSFRSECHIKEIVNEHSDTIPALYFEDFAFNKRIHDLLQPGHEAWAGCELVQTACYGIRVYQRGTYLHNHVDLTASHLISSTICVDFRLDSPWPLYIEDIHGEGHLVNLEPGEFIFYEGSKLIHGRPYPLDGDYYAGMFVHYRPKSGALTEQASP